MTSVISFRLASNRVLCLQPLSAAVHRQAHNEVTVEPEPPIHHVVRGQTSNLAAYKRGTGGRSSFSGLVVTVFGCSGYLGRYVVNRLGRIGSQIICPYRCEPYHVKGLKLAGDLGQVLFHPFHLRDEDSLRRVMKYSNVVINLIGRDYETRNFSFEDVHVTGGRTLARLARECGVDRFVQMSHLAAQHDPPRFFTKTGSRFLRTKYEAEEAVREEFPDAIIFRSADIWGMEDRFLNYYASRWRRSFVTMPLWKQGTQTIKSPVFCGNVADGIVRAIQDPTAKGKVFEAIGPRSYYLSDLVDYFYRCMRYPVFYRTPIHPVLRAKVWLHDKLFNAHPTVGLDRLEREFVNDDISGLPNLTDLGVKLTYMEDRVPWELSTYRKHAYYEDKPGEYPDPTPPPHVHVLT